jgi:transposase-like protein
MAYFTVVTFSRDMPYTIGTFSRSPIIEERDIVQGEAALPPSTSEATCISALEAMRWSGVPICPYCSSHRSTPLPKERRYHCNGCYVTYSVTVGTLFHRTHVPLAKWFAAIGLILAAGRPISARALARALRINRSTALRLMAQVRIAMLDEKQRPIIKSIAAWVGNPAIGARELRERGHGQEQGAD